MTTSTCPTCGSSFAYRSNKAFCSGNCRKLAHQRQQPNRSESRDHAAARRDLIERAQILAELLYTLPPSRRLGFINRLVEEARAGNSKLRQILSNQFLLKPDRSLRWLFWRSAPDVHLTIAQAADRYCRSSPWQAGVIAVVTGRAAIPETGEVDEPSRPKSVVTTDRGTSAQTVVTTERGTSEAA